MLCAVANPPGSFNDTQLGAVLFFGCQLCLSDRGYPTLKNNCVDIFLCKKSPKDFVLVQAVAIVSLPM